MKEVKIKNISQFLEYLDKRDMDTGSWGFRGVCSDTYDLIPSIGRPDVRTQYSRTWEIQIFNKFRQMAVPYLSPRPENSVLWLAVARHHGLPTRLLDWTLSPLVAAYFATCMTPRKDNADFAIYAYDSKYYDTSEIPSDPFSIEDDFIELHADYYTERMAAQRAFFTLHKNPDEPFRVKDLVKFVFPGSVRSQTLFTLDFYGVNKATLFPGLDGIAEYWGWFYKIAEGFD